MYLHHHSLDIVFILQVRYAAVNVIHELATRLGDEYMSLLPETIPFLAELMEGSNNFSIHNLIIIIIIDV